MGGGASTHTGKQLVKDEAKPAEHAAEKECGKEVVESAKTHHLVKAAEGEAHAVVKEASAAAPHVMHDFAAMKNLAKDEASQVHIATQKAIAKIFKDFSVAVSSLGFQLDVTLTIALSVMGTAINVNKDIKTENIPVNFKSLLEHEHAILKSAAGKESWSKVVVDFSEALDAEFEKLREELMAFLVRTLSSFQHEAQAFADVFSFSLTFDPPGIGEFLSGSAKVDVNLQALAAAASTTAASTAAEAPTAAASTAEAPAAAASTPEAPTAAASTAEAASTDAASPAAA